MVYFPVDFLSIFLKPEFAKTYDVIQFYLRVIVGIVATVSLMGVLGRLNSSFLNIPQSLIICLYVYASVQMLYPVIYENMQNQSVLTEVYNVKLMKYTVYIVAFAGKVCLFFVLRWIIQKRRFMFFVIHKAHTFIESEDMLKKFNRFIDE